jgi:hypothetical protein
MLSRSDNAVVDVGSGAAESANRLSQHSFRVDDAWVCD